MSPRSRDTIFLSISDVEAGLREQAGGVFLPDRLQLSHACRQTDYSSCGEHTPCRSPEDMKDETLHGKAH
jgi:hypothetical protein